MESVVLDIDSLRELNRMMYTMYKFFNYSLSNSVHKDFREFTPEDAIHLQLKPADYYHFQADSISIRIYQIRTHYTLKMCGVVTDKYPPYRPGSEFKYVNCFGDFDSLDSAKYAFYDVCNDYMKVNLGSLF